MPVHGIEHHLIQVEAVLCLAQALAHLGAVEQSGDLAQQLQMLLGGSLGDQQDE